MKITLTSGSDMTDLDLISVGRIIERTEELVLFDENYEPFENWLKRFKTKSEFEIISVFNYYLINGISGFNSDNNLGKKLFDNNLEIQSILHLYFDNDNSLFKGYYFNDVSDNEVYIEKSKHSAFKLNVKRLIQLLDN
jgi:hypothetical protein